MYWPLYDTCMGWGLTRGGLEPALVKGAHCHSDDQPPKEKPEMAKILDIPGPGPSAGSRTLGLLPPKQALYQLSYTWRYPNQNCTGAHLLGSAFYGTADIYIQKGPVWRTTPLVGTAGLEPAAYRLGGDCSIHLSYVPMAGPRWLVGNLALSETLWR